MSLHGQFSNKDKRTLWANSSVFLCTNKCIINKHAEHVLHTDFMSLLCIIETAAQPTDRQTLAVISHPLIINTHNPVPSLLLNYFTQRHHLIYFYLFYYVNLIIKMYTLFTEVMCLQFDTPTLTVV